MVVALAGAPAAAGPDGIAFEAPAGCPDRAAFLALVEQHAGAALPAGASGQVRVAEEPGRWSATVEVPGAASRRLDGASCAEVVDAAAFVLALAIEPAEPDPESESEPESESQPEPQPEPQPGRVPEPQTEARPVVAKAVPAGAADMAGQAPPMGAPLRLQLSTGGLADAGTLPGAAVAATLSASAWRGPSGLALSLALFRARDASAAGTAAGFAPVGLWAVGVRGCRRVWFAALCLGGEGGRMSADAGHLADGGERGAAWLALSGSGWVRGAIAGPVGVYAGVEILGAFARPRFVLDDDTGLHRPAPASARLALGLDVDVW
jgi:hypothetical protein